MAIFVLMLNGKKPRILVLYAQVQPFLIAGLRQTVDSYGASVLVVCWPPSQDAPFPLEGEAGIDYLIKNRDLKQIRQRIFDFSPDIVYCVGWMDKDYLDWARQMKHLGRKTVMAMDTQWRGDVRQRIHCLLSPFYLRRTFTHVWIPGYFQFEYARRLGFKREQILTSLLVGDAKNFRSPVKGRGTPDFPPSKTFIFVGRLVREKFLPLLEAFTSLTESEREGWKLVVIGKGGLSDHPLMADPDIIYKGFLSQQEVAREFARAGVFCLCAAQEPWGVVVQEAGQAGLPLIVSRQCGAYFTSVIDHYNGFLCDGENVLDIKNALARAIKTAPQDLAVMGERSRHLNSVYGPETWAASLMSTFFADAVL